jgi:hypothetical protein
MPQTTPRGVPYVVGGDVAGAYPETSSALAVYVDERIIDRRGDTIPGPLSFAATATFGLTTFNEDATFVKNIGARQGIHLPGLNLRNTAPPSWLVRDEAGWMMHLPDSAFRLYVASIASGSTAALKTGIDDPARTPDITALTPRQFEWTDDAYAAMFPGQRYGLIAEETAQVDRRLVSVNPEDGAPIGLDQHALIAALIAKVTELQARIDALEARP